MVNMERTNYHYKQQMLGTSIFSNNFSKYIFSAQTVILPFLALNITFNNS